MAQTVCGLVPPEALGITLTHEHLLSSAPHVAAEPADPGARVTFESPFGIDVLSRVRYGGEVNRDNCALQDIQAAVEEVAHFKRLGGGTVVDATSIGIARNPDGLRTIAQASGLNIVMGSSYYVEQTYPEECRVLHKSEDEIVAEIVRDILDGVDGTDVRAGLIGEVGCSWPLTECEEKVLTASARAQSLTGAPLTIHPGRNRDAPREILEILRSAGADLHRTIMCHIDRTVDDKATLREIARTGCVLEYDLFGTENSYYPWSLDVDMPNDGIRLRQLAWLIEQGFGDQLVISHDVFFKHQLVRYGGHGYGHILANVVPWMRRKGMGDADIDGILVQTPKRLLTFV